MIPKNNIYPKEGGQNRLYGSHGWDELPGVERAWVRRVISVQIAFEARVWEGEGRYPGGWGAAKSPAMRGVELDANPGMWWYGLHGRDHQSGYVPARWSRGPTVVGPFHTREEAFAAGEQELQAEDAAARLGAAR